MSDFSILLKTILSSEIGHLEQQIRDLSDKIKEKIKIKVDIDTGDLDAISREIKSQVENIRKGMKIDLPPIEIPEIQKGGFDVDKIKEYKDEVDKTQKSVATMTDEFNRQIDIIEKLSAETGKLEKAGSNVTTNYKKQADMLHKQKIQQEEMLDKIRKTEATKGKFISEEDTERLKDISDYVKTLDPSTKSFAKNLESAKLEFGKIVNDADIYKSHLLDIKQSHSTIQKHYKDQVKSIDQQIKQNQTVVQQQKKILQDEMKKSDLYKKNEIAQEKLLNQLRRMAEMNKATIESSGLSKNVENLEKSITSINPKSRDFNNQLDESKLKVSQLGTEIAITNQELQKGNIFAPLFGQSLWEAGKKFASWLFIGNIIMQAIRQVRDGIKFIKELDKDLTEISMITGMTRDQTRELAHEYAVLGAELGKTVKEISAVNKELIRQGLTMDVAKKRMEDIMKFSATAAITAEESLQIITSSVNAMKESAEVTSDILLKAGAVSASSAAQIGEAFTKTASSAHATGMSIESLTAILATMIEITQESPSSLGNSMKTLLARFNKVNEETGELNEELNQVQKAFESVGVTFIDLDGQIRPVDSLLANLSVKWKDLDKNTKLYVATQAAGKHICPSYMVTYKSKFLLIKWGNPNVKTRVTHNKQEYSVQLQRLSEETSLAC